MGKKFIIEIDDAYLSMTGHVPARLYRVKGFNSLVFDENGLNKLTPYDESASELRGAEKAWELAKKISIMPDEAKKEVWGTDKYNTINLGYSYAEAAERYEAWMKKKNEIKVGDEVSDCTCTGVVIDIRGDCFRILYSNGASYLISKKEFKKIGRHIPEVADLLKKIGGDNDCTEM